MRYDILTLLPERAFRKIGRTMTLEGKGDSPPPPDYTPLADASKESAAIMATLGKEQLDFSKQQYLENKPLYEKIVNSQISTQDATNKQGQEYYDYQTKTFRPIEQGLADEAHNYNTAAKAEELAGKASADVATADANRIGQASRTMAAMGVNPNSAKFAAVMNQNGLASAASRASAMTGARREADATGWAKKLDVTGLGRNLPGASTAAYGMAINAGNSAGSNQSAPGALAMNGMAQGANTTGSGRTMMQSGLGSILNAQSSAYANAPDNSGALIGAGGAVASAYFL